MANKLFNKVMRLIEIILKMSQANLKELHFSRQHQAAIVNASTHQYRIFISNLMTCLTGVGINRLLEHASSLDPKITVKFVNATIEILKKFYDRMFDLENTIEEKIVPSILLISTLT